MRQGTAFGSFGSPAVSYSCCATTSHPERLNSGMNSRIALACTVLLATVSASAADKSTGEYLTKHVAMCVECHSPRDAQGNLIESQLFLGAAIPVTNPNSNWATWAPRIARLPGGGWTQEQFIRFLETGVRPNGTRPRHPMPPFRMNRADAEAIATYLRSLNNSK